MPTYSSTSELEALVVRLYDRLAALAVQGRGALELLLDAGRRQQLALRVAAGDPPCTLMPGQVARIFTGAPVPTGEVGEACLAQIDNLEDYLEEIERKLIMQALEETRWNRTAAAERLGLTFRSMRYRLKKLGID
mgnify:CR=1 FL=1